MWNPAEPKFADLGGGGGKLPFSGLTGPKLSALAALLTLAALLAAALLSLAPARADGHPPDLELLLTIKDDLDNVIPPDSEFTVEAALRFTGPHNLERRLSLADASLRIIGALDWDTADAHGSRLDIDDQFVIGTWEPLTLPGAPPDMNMTARAFDRRTLVGRADDNRLHLFDAWNRRYVTAISAPPGAAAGDFGASVSSEGPGIAVWQENDLTAWLFVGSIGDVVNGNSGIGRLYIYKIDWSQTPVAVRLERSLEPDSAEFSNVPVTDQNQDSYYGSAVVISNDGGTLAVSAYDMNDMGAVYLYERPTGEGRDWSDISYSDGIRVTAAAIPPWGAANMAPFNYTSMGRTGANSDCDAYCSRVTTLRKSRLGFWGVALSADGRVLAVGAPYKDQDSTTPGGSLTLQGGHDTGEVFVFVAPDDGWGSVQGVSETDKELIAAGEDASDFDPAEHYSPGPDRRVTEPTATLIASAWASSEGNAQLGRRVAISRDGSTVAAQYRAIRDDGAAAVQVFQRDSAADWAGAGSLLPSATLSGFKDPGLEGGIAFSPDGSQLLVGDGEYDSPRTDAGRVSFFERPANGRWASASVGSARFRIGRNLDIWDIFAWVLYDLSGERLAISDEAADSSDRGEVGHIWLSDAGCLPAIVDGLTTSICTIELGDARIAVPPGDFPSGAFTITAVGSLSLDDSAHTFPLRGSLDVTVSGDVREVVETNFDFATDTRGTSTTADDRPWPSAIADGQSTTFELTILNENGVRSSPVGISAVLLTSTAGELGAALPGGCESGGGARTCQIAGSRLVGLNLGRVGVTLTHPGQPGSAVVEGTIVTPSGEIFRTEPRTVVFTGPADSLTIAPAATALLNVGTPDAGADQDNRDLLTLSVTAVDKTGYRVDVPTNGLRARLTGPDGARVASGVDIEWPLGGADNPRLDDNGERQVRVNINRAAAQALANGEYTLSLNAGSLTAEQTFTVSGGPAALILSAVEGPLAVNQQITLTASVLDADGNPVPNDTPIEWSAADVGTTPVLIQLAADAKTTNGQASASWLVLSAGAATVRAQAGDAATVRLLDIAAAMAAAAPDQPSRPADHLNSRAPGFAVWSGRGTTTAAALLNNLENINGIALWVPDVWLRYTRINTADSFNFQVLPGAVLWLSE